MAQICIKWCVLITNYSTGWIPRPGITLETGYEFTMNFYGNSNI